MELTGCYRKFVQNYGLISKPLTDLLKKDSFHWNAVTQEAVQTLRQAMTKAPVLALPDFSKPFVIESDASGMGMGVVLQQGGHPIAYISKAFSSSTSSLSVYGRELLAITFAVSK